MAAYASPHSNPYSNAAYAGPPPQVQVQRAPFQPVQQTPYQRARGSSNGSYDGPRHAQQFTSYAAAAPYSSPALAPAPNGQAYFAPMPHAQSSAALVPAAAQLHPQEAYALAAADPYAQRPRTNSTASHYSHHSHHSSASHHSHHSHRSKASSRNSGNDEDRRKPGERATLGDTLMGMWRVLRDMIPTEKR